MGISDKFLNLTDKVIKVTLGAVITLLGSFLLGAIFATCWRAFELGWRLVMRCLVICLIFASYMAAGFANT